MVLGLAVAICILMLSEKMIHHFFTVSHTLFEPEAGKSTETTSTSDIDTQLIVLLFAHALASFFGGMTVARFVQYEWKKFSIRLGVVLTLFNILNLFLILHPLWFITISILIYVPFSYLGGRTMQR
jgi:hypothetical protein